MNSDFGIALVGVGGYGRNHLESIRRCGKTGHGTLQAVTIRPEDSEPEIEAELVSDGVTIFRDFDRMLQSTQDRCSLVAIPTGIPSHRNLTVKALNAGFHVICEKPAAGSVEDVEAMRQAKNRSGRLLAIGYQYLYSKNVQRIKEIAVSGTLGKLLNCRCLALWPRGGDYYARNEWAGRLESGGTVVRDSPAQNAVSHYLNTMLFLAGTTYAKSATPASVYGENYRAKPIESADTQFVRVKTVTGAVIEFWCSHAGEHHIDIEMILTFERGEIKIRCTEGFSSYVIAPAQGVPESAIELVENEEADAEIRFRVFAESIEAAKRGESPVSSIENAAIHTLVIESLFERCSPVRLVSKVFIQSIPDTSDGDSSVHGTNVIKGLESISADCFERRLSYHEAGAKWAHAGIEVSLI